MHKKIFLLSFVTILVLTAGLAQAVTLDPGDLTDDGGDPTCDPKPIIESIDPESVKVGSPGFEFSVFGSNFTSESSIQFNGISFATNFISFSELRLAFKFNPTTPGKFNITVTNPGSWFCGGTSNTLVFEVLGNPPPPPPPPATGRIVLVKNTLGNPVGTFSFITGGFSLNTNPVTTANGQHSQNVMGLATNQTYSISENQNPPGWSFTSASCKLQNGASTGIISGASMLNIAVVANQATTCTFTNTFSSTPPPDDDGILTISKMAIGGNGTFRFSVFPTPGIIFIASGASLSLPLKAGSYFVAETVLPGWSLEGVTCSGALYTPITNGISIVVTPGSTPACVFNNRLLTSNSRPRLTVNKILIPAPGSANDPGRFILKIDGNNISGPVGNGGTTGAYETFVGPHTVGESATPGTNPADYDYAFGGDCDSTGHVTLAAGESKSCTIINTRKPVNPPGGPILTLRKVCIPNSDTDEFVLRINNSFGTLAPFTNCGGSTNPLPVTAGSTYALSEAGYPGTDLSKYDTAISCRGGNQSGNNITILPGQDATCTFTNTLKSPPESDIGRLQIIKKAKGANAEFIFEINGPTSLRPTIPTNADEGVWSSEVKAGTYAITEKIPNDWKFDDVNCDRSGYVKDSFGLQGLTVVAGQTTTCTFENHQLGFLTIKKNTIGGEGIFNYDIPPYTARIDTAKKDSAGPTPFNPGSSYTVTEKNLAEGWQFNSVSCDKSFSANNASLEARNVTIVAGQNTTCTFTNTFEDEEPPPGTLHIIRIDPEKKSACDSADLLTVTGTGFRSDSEIHFGPLKVATDASNAASGKLTADISQTPEGSHKITVVNPNPNGATSDNFKTFTVSGAEGSGNPPVIGSISPTSASSPKTSFTLTVTGENFTPDSVINFNDYAKETIFDDENTISARIPESSTPRPWSSYQVTVTNPSGNSGSCQENDSNSKLFWVYGDADEPSSINEPQNNVPFTLPPEIY